MLDKVIHKHLDIMDKIEDDLSDDIEKIISSIDIDAVLNSPQDEMDDIVNAIYELMLEKYFDRVIQAGISFSGEIAENKKIVVDDSNNPNLNKELVESV